MRTTLGTAILCSCLAACGGGGPAAETANPAGGTTGAGTPTAAEAPAPDGEEARPCVAFAREAERCAAEQQGFEPLAPEEQQWVTDRMIEECRRWLQNGLLRAEIFDALEQCAGTSCADGPLDWSRCVTEAIPAASWAGRIPAPGEPMQFVRIEPRPIDASADPCEIFIDWTVECLRETLGPEGMTPDVEAMVRDAHRQVCDSFETSGVSAALPQALRACADVGCGEGGGDLALCIGMELAETLSEAAAPAGP